MKRQKLILYLLLGAELLVFYIIQGTPFLIPELFGSKPLLLLPLAFSAAPFEDEANSAAIGAVCGIFTDLGAGRIGYFAIFMTVICFFESYLMNKYIVSGIAAASVIAFAATALLIGGYFLIFFVAAGIEGSGVYFVNHYISRIIYSFLPIFPLYYLNRFLYRKSNRKKG